jgi:NADH dehydrogenase
MSKHVVVIGGGFAGLWSAVGAARKRKELGLSPERLRITLVDRNDYHAIRVRNYEPNLEEHIVGFDRVLAPIGVERVQAEVTEIDVADQVVHVRDGTGRRPLAYDRLVFALGSHLHRPPIPGIAEHAFDVDTHVGARRLRAHLYGRTPAGKLRAERGVVVVGAGLTGIELATETMTSLKPAGSSVGRARVLLLDGSNEIGSHLGREAKPVVAQALEELGIETRTGVRVASVHADGVTLATGETILAGTVVWCAGMRASPLTGMLDVERDAHGRLSVDELLRVEGVRNVLAAGDSARARLDDSHVSVMSCQHGRPMGRFAGHNVVADLMGEPMLPLRIDWYVTVLDLGAWGALYTEGWDRHVVAVKDAAKATKRLINGSRIYPPISGDPEEILAAAAPVVQAPPQYRARAAG